MVTDAQVTTPPEADSNRENVDGCSLQNPALTRRPRVSTAMRGSCRASWPPSLPGAPGSIPSSSVYAGVEGPALPQPGPGGQAVVRVPAAPACRRVCRRAVAHDSAPGEGLAQTWRVLAKEAYFPQRHKPGQLGQSDFTDLSWYGVTLQGRAVNHLLYHCVLTYSNWETVRICFSESFEALSAGLQDALWELGGRAPGSPDRLPACWLCTSSATPTSFTRRILRRLRGSATTCKGARTTRAARTTVGTWSRDIIATSEPSNCVVIAAGQPRLRLQGRVCRLPAHDTDSVQGRTPGVPF